MGQIERNEDRDKGIRNTERKKEKETARIIIIVRERQETREKKTKCEKRSDGEKRVQPRNNVRFCTKIDKVGDKFYY